MKPKELDWLDLRAGDVLAVHSGKSLIAKGIVTHMKLWLKANGYDPKSFEFIPHHIARIVDVWGTLQCAEAIEKGVVVRPLLDSYTLKEWKERVIVLRRKSGYSDDQIKAMSKEAQRLALIGTPYEFGNFWRHIVYFLNAKRKWYGGGKSDEAFYCSELGAWLEDIAYPDSFKYPHTKNPVEIYLYHNYQQIYP